MTNEDQIGILDEVLIGLIDSTPLEAGAQILGSNPPQGVAFDYGMGNALVVPMITRMGRQLDIIFDEEA